VNILKNQNPKDAALQGEAPLPFAKNAQGESFAEIAKGFKRGPSVRFASYKMTTMRAANPE
jgi:hypothetical protein